MTESLVGLGSALWLGILTSISPCPLATHITAVSYLSRKLNHPRQILWAGLLYTAGRAVAYLALGVVMVAGLLSVPLLSVFLQEYMNKLLGPILIVAGMFLLELLHVDASGGRLGMWAQQRADAWGSGGAFLLGMLLALSFCPLSAALFFGSLVPLAVGAGSAVVLPAVYGVGTALPVLAFAVLIAAGARTVGRAFDAATRIEPWLRQGTGALFIAVGVYYSLRYIFGIIS
jgi:cytochrome c-type biogenesis protein